MPREPGICELLRNEADLEEAIQPVMGMLDVITSGTCDAQAIRALGQDVLPDLLHRLRQRYDLIVIDSAPVLPVADTLLVSQHVDAAVFSVYRDVSRLPTVYAGHERLVTLGVRVLGVVLTGIPADHYGEPFDYGGSTLR